MPPIPIHGLLNLMKKMPTDYFFEESRIGEEILVIDGNSIMKKIYINMENRYDCFGGNYDCYAKEVKQFFHKLKDVKVTPFVSLFGGTFIKQPTKAISEIQKKITQVKIVNPNSDKDVTVYPLWLREVFLDVLVEEKIKKVQFDFEDLLSTAFIARYLSAPVLGDDPTYYIYDVKYIPYDSLKLNRAFVTLKTDPATNQRFRFKYFLCKTLKTDTLLEYLKIEKQNKHQLPFYAAILSCEDHSHTYILNQIKSAIEEKERVDAEVPDGDVDELTEHFEHLMLQEAFKYHPDTTYVVEKIEKLMRSYGYAKSMYLKYLGIATEGEDLSHTLIPTLTNKPDFFLDKLRNCMYPPGFVDLIHSRKWYLYPQVELLSLEYTHAISYNMISILYKILTESNTQFSFFVRSGNTVVEKIFPPYKHDVTSLLGIQNMKLAKTRRVHIDLLIPTNTEGLKKMLDTVPENWHLFLIAMKIFVKYYVNWTMVYSMLMCKIILTAFEEKVGFYRSQVPFKTKFEGTVMEEKPEPPQIRSTTTINEMLQMISFEESMIVMNKVVKHFEMTSELKDKPEYFERLFVHHMCEFQSCLLHVKYLNDVFDLPYANCEMAKTFNGTFIYNLTNEIHNSKLSFPYTQELSKEAPVVSKILESIMDKLEAS